jgi:hypothetical protein
MSNFDEAYDNYFKKADSVVRNDNVAAPGVISDNLISQMPEKSSRPRMTANGNIANIDGLGDALRKLLNTAWGTNWGLIAPDTAKGEDPNVIKTPQINYGVNLREITPNSNPKATLTDTINEVVNGKNTGDTLQVYRKFYDCIIEFNFWDTTSKGCRDLMDKFEDLIDLYSGYLKSQGISEIFFLKEVPPSYSLNYVEGTPMKCIYFFVRLEKIKTVRLSVIKEIEYKLTAENAVTDSSQKSDEIKQKITYKL